MSNWTDKQIQDVWEKGAIVEGISEHFFRKDQCGAWMSRAEYGNRDSDEGWEIDHIKTKSSGGTDILSNLRPLQWKNNAGRSDGRLKTKVTSDGGLNVDVDDDAA
ncbi:HNH endonuclease signature motif containing protein [Pectobacterium colocasium]|uniref:HNH endonuclease signature motif containing protein n=1 Tax=Pectobacterium TaxID=122277 RepID=UPI0027A22E6A|nr:HNH endonuclease signature motif containing protein [Pectobacterium colocasium]